MSAINNVWLTRPPAPVIAAGTSPQVYGWAPADIAAAIGSLGFVNPMTGVGDFIRGGAGGAPTRLAPPGADGAYNVTFTSDVPSWTPAGGGSGLTLLDKVRIRANAGVTAADGLSSAATDDYGWLSLSEMGSTANINTLPIGQAIQCSSSASAGSAMGWRHNAKGVGATGCYGVAATIQLTGTLTDVRVAVGITLDATGSQVIVTTDTPNRPCAYIGFSDDLSETEWMICTQDANAGPLTRASTGVTIDRSKGYEIAVGVDDGVKVFWAIRETGSQTVHEGSTTTTPPDSATAAAGAGATPIAGGSPTVASSRSIAVADIKIAGAPTGAWGT